MGLLPAIVAAVAALPPPPATAWRRLADGIESARVLLVEHPRTGDGLLSLVRIDPAKAELRALLAKGLDESVTAAQWARAQKLVAVINAGMYEKDLLTHVGYARVGAHARNGSWKKTYESALAFGPRRKGLPAAVLLDLDEPGARERVGDYDTVLQNLRILKGNGVNVWSDSAKAWSEAAVALDDRGRVLFLFIRTPVTMKQFGDRLVGLGIGIVRAMHMEGGPEASLSVHVGGLDVDLNGCPETGFVDPESAGACGAQWRLPNVLGVVARP